MIDEDKNGIDDTITKEDLEKCDTEFIGDAVKSGVQLTPNVIKLGIAKKEKEQASLHYRIKAKVYDEAPALFWKWFSGLVLATIGIMTVWLQGLFGA